jgi:hypothetical protein
MEAMAVFGPVKLKLKAVLLLAKAGVAAHNAATANPRAKVRMVFMISLLASVWRRFAEILCIAI